MDFTGGRLSVPTFECEEADLQGPQSSSASQERPPAHSQPEKGTSGRQPQGHEFFQQLEGLGSGFFLRVSKRELNLPHILNADCVKNTLLTARTV